jgi:hypothetical protein
MSPYFSSAIYSTSHTSLPQVFNPYSHKTFITAMFAISHNRRGPRRSDLRGFTFFEISSYSHCINARSFSVAESLCASVCEGAASFSLGRPLFPLPVTARGACPRPRHGALAESAQMFSMGTYEGAACLACAPTQHALNGSGRNAPHANPQAA